MNMLPTRVAECLACVRACVRVCCYYSIVPAEYMSRAAVPKASGCSCIPREQEFFLQSGSHRKYQFVNTKKKHLMYRLASATSLWSPAWHMWGKLKWKHTKCDTRVCPTGGVSQMPVTWQETVHFNSNRQLKTGERLKPINLTYRLLENLVPHSE